METIPVVYWMIIITVLVGFISFVLYEFAMLIRESKKAISDSRDIIKEAENTVEIANGLLTDTTEIVSTIKGTVYEVNSSIVGPIKKISSVLSAVSGFSEGLTSRRR